MLLSNQEYIQVEFTSGTPGNNMGIVWWGMGVSVLISVH